MVKNILSSMGRNDFLRHIFTLMTGSSLAIVITLICSPILTRFYSPEIFGIFALYAALTSILGNISAARYDVTILLPTKQENADSLLMLCGGIIAVFGVILTLFFMMFGNIFFDLINYSNLVLYKMIVPIMVCLIGVQLTLNAYCNRLENYKFLATSKVLDSLFLNGVSIALGYIGGGVWGMVLGMMCGRIVSISYLIFKQRKNIWKAVLGWNSRNNLKMAKRYGSFPKHSVIATLTGSLSANVHLFLFLSFYGDIIVGIIALATRLILNPLGVISTSFSQVFYKKLAGIDNFLDLRSLYIKSILGLTAIALIVISVMYVLPRNFIGFVLGNEWSDMLLPLQIIVWWFAVQFVAGSVSVIFTRLEKESYIFYIQALNLALSVSTLVYAHSLGMSSEGALSLFVVAKVILYIVVMVFPIIYLVRDDKKIS